MMDEAIRQNNLTILPNVPVEVIQVLRWLNKARWKGENRESLKHFHIEDKTITTSDGMRLHQAIIPFPKFPDGVFDISITADRMLIFRKAEHEKNCSRTFAKTISDSLDHCIPIDAGKATKKLEVFTRINPKLLADALSISSEGFEVRIGGFALVLRGVKSVRNLEAAQDISLLAMVMPLHVKDGGAWVEWKS